MDPAVPDANEQAHSAVDLPILVGLLRGGASVGQGTLSRFYTVHTLVLPLFATAGLLVHFLLIRKQGISGPL